MRIPTVPLPSTYDPSTYAHPHEHQVHGTSHIVVPPPTDPTTDPGNGDPLNPSANPETTMGPQLLAYLNAMLAKYETPSGNPGDGGRGHPAGDLSLIPTGGKPNSYTMVSNPSSVGDLVTSGGGVTA